MHVAGDAELYFPRLCSHVFLCSSAYVCDVCVLLCGQVVGKGGFGKVNAITKLDTGELMALKRMEKYAVLQSSSHLKMVWIERKIMSLTASPFLCNLLYAFENEREVSKHARKPSVHSDRSSGTASRCLLRVMCADVCYFPTVLFVCAAVPRYAVHAGR
jgi:serine/threonine protein kinase